MKHRIRIVVLALLLVAAGLLSFGAPSALAEDIIYTEGTLYYTEANESITIVGCFGRDAEVWVPAMIAGVPVNTIATGAFTENKHIQTLYLPDTIMRIEEGAIGDWIYVVYNANTDHPQDTPTELILGEVTLIDPAEQGPSDQIPSIEPGSDEAIGSGSENLDDGSGTAVKEGDVELTEPDESPTPSPTAAPSPSPSAAPSPDPAAETPAQEGTTEETPAPEQPAQSGDQPEAQPAAEQNDQTQKKTSGGVWALSGLILAAGAGAVAVKVRKDRKED